MKFTAWPVALYLLAGLSEGTAFAQQNPSLPQHPGECVTTTITDIHPRMGEKASDDPTFISGTVVEYANGGRQVSYEREDAILRSRLGDEVEMCLGFPQVICPAEDQRGREYWVMNKRTGESWELPDSAHYCGGA